MTYLREHLEKEQISQADFARAIQVSRPYMSQIVGGSKTPSLRVAARIESATQGAVPIQTWFQVGAA